MLGGDLAQVLQEAGFWGYTSTVAEHRLADDARNVATGLRKDAVDAARVVPLGDENRAVRALSEGHRDGASAGLANLFRTRVVADQNAVTPTVIMTFKFQVLGTSRRRARQAKRDLDNLRPAVGKADLVRARDNGGDSLGDLYSRSCCAPNVVPRSSHSPMAAMTAG